MSTVAQNRLRPDSPERRQADDQPVAQRAIRAPATRVAGFLVDQQTCRLGWTAYHRAVHRMLVASLLLSLAAVACSGSGDSSEVGSSSLTAGPATSMVSTTIEPAGSLTVANLNLLHGLDLGEGCPPETAGCQAVARLGLVLDAVEAAGCPEVLTFQEVGPEQQELIPESLSGFCDGAYQLISERPGLPVEQWTLSTLPLQRAISEPISGLSRSAQLVTVDTEFGPVDIFNTHFVADIDNLPCQDQLCGDICTPGELAGDCNPSEIIDFVEREADPDTPTILAGDLNAEPHEERIAVLNRAGFFDTVRVATELECVPAEGHLEVCTSGIDGPGPYVGLDRPDRTFDRQIDFIMLQRTDRDCRFGAVTGPWLDQPASAPVDGVYWPSDHAGVLTEFLCN